MICFDWCDTSELTAALSREIVYDVESREFDFVGKPVHVAWYMLRCSRCPRAFLLKGTDELSCRLAIESFLRSRSWLLKAPHLFLDSQELMLICPDCATPDDYLTDRID